MSNKLRLIVLGMMGRNPFGGQTWLYLNWIRAFSRLGHEVYYIEDDTVWPYDPEQNTVTDDCSYAVRHIADCMRRIGLPDTASICQSRSALVITNSVSARRLVSEAPGRKLAGDRTPWSG